MLCHVNAVTDRPNSSNESIILKLVNVDLIRLSGSRLAFT